MLFVKAFVLIYNNLLVLKDFLHYLYVIFKDFFLMTQFVNFLHVSLSLLSQIAIVYSELFVVFLEPFNFTLYAIESGL